MNKMNWSLTRNSVTGTRELSHFIKKRRVKHTDDLANLSHYPLVQRIPHLHPCPYLLCALVIKYQDIKHKCLFIYMNTFWAPHLERSPKHFTMPSIVLLSLRLRLSYATLNEWQLLYAAHFEYPLRWLQCCSGAAWPVPREMLPSRRKFCVHHTTMHQFTASLYSKPHRLNHKEVHHSPELNGM